MRRRHAELLLVLLLAPPLLKATDAPAIKLINRSMLIKKQVGFKLTVWRGVFKEKKKIYVIKLQAQVKGCQQFCTA